LKYNTIDTETVTDSPFLILRLYGKDMKGNIILLVILLPVFFLLTSCHEKIRLVTGSYTESGENGINVFDFNSSEGKLKLVSVFNAGPDPSYFCISEKNKMIYVINEVSKFNGTDGGGLTTLKYEGCFENIEKVNDMQIPNGGPCFISLTPDNGFLMIANYGGGSVAIVKLDKNGIPEEVCDTIIYGSIEGKASRAHMISSDPAGNRIYVTDLGLDRIMIYTIDKTTGKLIPFKAESISLPKGTGPRHFAFNDSGTKMYVAGELNSKISVFSVDPTVGLISIQTISAREEGYSGVNYCADIHIGKNGSRLYCSNRGENSIVTFMIGSDGTLTPSGKTSCAGNWPRNFTIDPSGKYILMGNQKSGNITVLKIDRKSGVPSKVTQNINIKSPACLKFQN
jgi:6-phosphogluconolactonase